MVISPIEVYTKICITNMQNLMCFILQTFLELQAQEPGLLDNAEKTALKRKRGSQDIREFLQHHQEVRTNDYC